MVNGEAKGLVKSPFLIDKNTKGVTFTPADIVDGSIFVDLLSYAVPLGTAIEITPVNYHFGTYKATDTTTQITAGSTRLMKQNANGTESREVWQGENGIFKDIGDEFQRPKLRIPVIINASQVLVVQIMNLGTTLDSIESNYSIECMQFYEEI